MGLRLELLEFIEGIVDLVLVDAQGDGEQAGGEDLSLQGPGAQQTTGEVALACLRSTTPSRIFTSITDSLC